MLHLYDTVEKLQARRDVLIEKIKKSVDMFIIYGYARELEAIDKTLTKLEEK